MKLSTVDQRLNIATAGTATDLTLVSRTPGPRRSRASCRRPRRRGLDGQVRSGDRRRPDRTARPTVIAHLTPSADAIAGDYVTAFKATADLATARADIRVTVETSLLCGAIGIALIAIVLVGLWWIFRRFGRR